MNLAEKLVKAYQNNEPMPLKGHTKITLTDVKTGEKQVIEKDNMVTNSVSSLTGWQKRWASARVGFGHFADRASFTGHWASKFLLAV